jgi:hypothetical protein
VYNLQYKFAIFSHPGIWSREAYRLQSSTHDDSSDQSLQYLLLKQKTINHAIVAPIDRGDVPTRMGES